MELYVIGNGFDRHFELHTSPYDFKKFLSKEKVYNTRDNACDTFSCYGVYWSDFEVEIASIDLSHIEDSQLQYPDYTSDHESDRDGCILNMQMHLASLRTAVVSAFRKMSIAANKTDINQNYCFDSDYIINFNYTNTVERVSINPLYKPVFYIHGSAESNDDLIFGYKNSNSVYNADKFSDIENGDYYLDTQVKAIDAFYHSLKKNTKVSELEDYLKGISDSIESVCVLGHSLGEVDLQYFEIINQLINPSKWRISYHGDTDPVINNIKRLSFYDKVSLFPW